MQNKLRRHQVAKLLSLIAIIGNTIPPWTMNTLPCPAMNGVYYFPLQALSPHHPKVRDSCRRLRRLAGNDAVSWFGSHVAMFAVFVRIEFGMLASTVR